MNGKLAGSCKSSFSPRIVVGSLFTVLLAACAVATDDSAESSSASLRNQSDADFDKAYGPELEPESSDFVGDDGSGLRVLSLDRNETRGFITEEERALIEQHQRDLNAAARPQAAIREQSTTERALDEAAKLPEDMMMELGIELEDPPFGFHRIREASDAARTNLIDARRAQLERSQSAIEKAVIALGGEILGRMWLVNVVDVRVPAGKVAEVARLPGVFSISPNEAAYTEGWDGQQIRAGVLLDGAGLADSKADFYQGCGFLGDQDVCHDGMTGSRLNASQRVRIGIIENGASNDVSELILRTTWAGAIRPAVRAGSSRCISATPPPVRPRPQPVQETVSATTALA